MSGEQWGEAVEAAIDVALDQLKPWTGPKSGDLVAINATRAVTIAINAAAPLIVADTRRKVAEERSPYVWVAPGRLGGKPCIGGHRIDADAVANFAWVDGVAGVQIAYPWLTRAEILTACWFQSKHGGRVRGRRWKPWVEEHASAMWAGRWDDVPDPLGMAAAIARGSGNGDSGPPDTTKEG